MCHEYNIETRNVIKLEIFVILTKVMKHLIGREYIYIFFFNILRFCLKEIAENYHFRLPKIHHSLLLARALFTNSRWRFSSLSFSDLHVPTRVRPCEQPTMLFPHRKFIIFVVVITRMHDLSLCLHNRSRFCMSHNVIR